MRTIVNNVSGCSFLNTVHFYFLVTCGQLGGAENAGVEKAGVENAGADSRGGKCRSRSQGGVENAGAITDGKP